MFKADGTVFYCCFWILEKRSKAFLSPDMIPFHEFIFVRISFIRAYCNWRYFTSTGQFWIIRSFTSSFTDLGDFDLELLEDIVFFLNLSIFLNLIFGSRKFWKVCIFLFCWVIYLEKLRCLLILRTRTFSINIEEK